MEEDETIMTSSIGRWVPTVVVVAALSGFIGLGWYAYKSGAQSLKDDDLLVVEADKTPMKEKPLDPGGMKFPNQDKTVFETFASNAQIPPKVEKLLPAPEEPLPKEMDTSDTQTFVNDKLHQNGGASEQVIGDKKPAEVAQAAAPAPAPAKEEAKPAAASNDDADSKVVSYSKPVAAPAAPAEKAPPAKAAGSSKIQLGAYRSAKEAKDGWIKMQKQFAQLANRSPLVIKADLGKKGIYYRLQVGGFASADEAKTFCGGLSAQGQSCLPVKD